MRPVIVDVFADKDGNEVTFSLAWKREGEAQGRKGRIDVTAGDADTPIHFHLTDRSGLHLSFMTPAEDAMWVDLNGCPTGPGNGGQIEFGSVSNKLLKVTDLNQGPECTLHYALRFDGQQGPGGPPFTFDPEIRNGGGGKLR